MRPKLSVISRSQAGYVAIVLAAALVAFLPSDPNVVAYVTVLVLTLPLSIIAMPVMFVVVGFTFSANGSLWLRLVVIGLWTGMAVVEAVVWREVLRAVRERRHSLLG